jgi:hypothetical protein
VSHGGGRHDECEAFDVDIDVDVGVGDPDDEDNQLFPEDRVLLVNSLSVYGVMVNPISGVHVDLSHGVKNEEH